MEQKQENNNQPPIEEGVVQVTGDVSSYLLAQKAQIDIQISTAKAYPRDLRKSMENAVVTVTLNEETAKSCIYELPRAGKKIKGASVHLASILAQNYGNFRAEARVTEVSDKYVSAEAVALDLETNFAVKVEVRRKILDKYGNRYKEDMIHTTGLAASAIAYRNAVLRVIPRAVTDHVYNSAMNKITGDLSDEQKLLKARTQWIKYYKKTYEATEEEIVTLCGVKTITGIGADQIATLIGTDQAIKDGSTTADEVFERITAENKDPETEKKKADEFYDEKDEKPQENNNGELDLK